MHRMSSTARACAATFIMVTLVGVLGASTAFAVESTGLGFHARDIRGGTAGAVRLTGGGAFDASTGVANTGGGFRCTESVGQGPLAGCQAGEGTHWHAETVLASTPFKCTSSAAESLKTATTGADTVVLRAEFFRAGDGNQASFTANVFVSTRDLAPDVAGVQNVWIQGVGCDFATTNLSA